MFAPINKNQKCFKSSAVVVIIIIVSVAVMLTKTNKWQQYQQCVPYQIFKNLIFFFLNKRMAHSILLHHLLPRQNTDWCYLIYFFFLFVVILLLYFHLHKKNVKIQQKLAETAATSFMLLLLLMLLTFLLETNKIATATKIQPFIMGKSAVFFFS